MTATTISATTPSSTTRTKLLPVVSLDGISIEYGTAAKSDGSVGEDLAGTNKHNSNGLLVSLFRQDSNVSTASSAGGLLQSVKFDLTGGPHGDASVLQETAGSATILSEVFNIAKNLLGAGVLSMSGGIAMYSNDPRAVTTATFWIILQAVMFGYFCILIAKVCQLTCSRTIRECWEATMGSGAVAVVTVITLNPAQGTLAYSAILSQTFRSLAETVGIRITRLEALLLITVGALLPLCLMKNIHVLAPYSIVGTMGVLFTAVAMVIRCLDGTYQPGGQYFGDIPVDMQPSFGSRNEPWTVKVLPLVCMIFEAYVMHYNVPRFYTELKRRSIPRFTACVGGSFGLAATCYIVIAAAGFLTFGGNADGYILNNYSAYDPLATACRLFIGISVLTTYPMAFIGFRDGVLDIMNISAHEQSDRTLNTLTVSLLTLITITAIFVTDLGMINAIGGGTIAAAMCFVFPAIMYRKAVRQTMDATSSMRLETKFAIILMLIGCALGILGVWQEVKESLA